MLHGKIPLLPFDQWFVPRIRPANETQTRYSPDVPDHRRYVRTRSADTVGEFAFSVEIHAVRSFGAMDRRA